MPIRTLIFLLCSVIFIIFSWRALFKPRTHGFYRFFVFEFIAALVLLNHPYWFIRPFSFLQCISWFLLATSILFVVLGLRLLTGAGGAQQRNSFPANHSFENTITLVEHGLYKYIRHPMYSSLLLLAWGACLKHVDGLTLSLSFLATAFLIVTAKVEEHENIRFFGPAYQQYRQRSKMFIPFVL